MTVVLFSYTIHVSSQREHSPFKSRWIYLFCRFCGSFCAERYMRVYKRVDYRIYLHTVYRHELKTMNRRGCTVRYLHTIYTHTGWHWHAFLRVGTIYAAPRFVLLCWWFISKALSVLCICLYELKLGWEANIYSGGKVYTVFVALLAGGDIMSTKLLNFKKLVYGRAISHRINVIF